MTYLELLNFLAKVDKMFPVPLSNKTDLNDFAKKLVEKADLICEKENGKIVGLIAGYITNSLNDMSYISMVAVLPESRGKGIGKKLVSSFVEKSSKSGKTAVHLYAVRSNIHAMKMYENLGFSEWHINNEPRPDDVHFIYRIKNRR